MSDKHDKNKLIRMVHYHKHNLHSLFENNTGTIPRLNGLYIFALNFQPIFYSFIVRAVALKFKLPSIGAHRL
ncbi:hypothetical protein JL49_04550 [Pseudoalteromonas luteoviolacea]|uniref:Uncharacterized protein n=1 Tax=Pseudoalteromonas luteoviolacea NCIMB 1942 TaxID=1365253 RepID=A0A167C5B8_9GAMM|nr:hypothetical protein N482_10095 [Pseudoalteromonas luteoviolacea NCIMB 1942]KZX01633.1 hypothetical protein JL49_04550 [Pseudoalteromonas luteoviolacea]